MHGELTNQATANRLQEALQKQVEDQMEILLYKKNSKAIRTTRCGCLFYVVSPSRCIL